MQNNHNHAEDKKTAKTRDALKQLFQLTGISRMLFIDDEYSELSDDKINDIIGPLASLEEKDNILSSKIDQFKNINFDNDDIWTSQVKEIWRNSSLEERESLLNQIKKIIPIDAQGTFSEGSILKDLLDKPVEVDFKGLSYTSWKNSKTEYLNPKEIEKTLFLFDQDLSKEGGSDIEGIKIIRELLTKNDRIVCGLLSHTFSRDKEHDEWKKFAENFEMDKSRFVLIAKEHLSKDKLGFARMLRLTLLNKYCEEFKKSVSNIIKRTVTESKKKIDDLDIYDFEKIVFDSSSYEGVSEADTLFRLHGIYQRNIARKLLLEDIPRDNQTVEKIREISNIRINQQRDETDKIWKIQKMEIFDIGEHINKLHLPLEAGDIFEDTKNKKKYILIAQPCDLMVRSGIHYGIYKPEEAGKRKTTVNESVLAEIVESNQKDGGYKLLYFDDNGKSHYVDFKTIHTVSLEILDLCVFNKNGALKIVMGDTCPSLVMPTWKKRFEILHSKFKAVIEQYNESSKVNDNIRNLLLPHASNINKELFKPTVESDSECKSINYSGQRIMRLSQSRSSEMLIKYANYISRMAFEHDFGDTKK